MEDVAIVIGLFSGVASWWALARSMKINGRPWWLRHLAGSFLAPVASIGASIFLASLVGATDEDGEPLGVSGALGGLVVALPVALILIVSWKAARRHPTTTPVPAVKHEQPTAQEPEPEPEPEPELSPASGDAVCFVYEDAQGNLTIRKLTDWRDYGVYLEGFCEQAGDIRTFRRDRIVEVVYGEHLLERSATKPSRQQQPARKSSARHSSQKDSPIEILFTGFPTDQRESLEEDAESVGMKVRKGVTKNLDLVCAGPNAGPSKLSEARTKGCTVLNESQFWDLVEDGVLP